MEKQKTTHFNGRACVLANAILRVCIAHRRVSTKRWCVFVTQCIGVRCCMRTWAHFMHGFDYAVWAVDYIRETTTMTQTMVSVCLRPLCMCAHKSVRLTNVWHRRFCSGIAVDVCDCQHCDTVTNIISHIYITPKHIPYTIFLPRLPSYRLLLLSLGAWIYSFLIDKQTFILLAFQADKMVFLCFHWCPAIDVDVCPLFYGGPVFFYCSTTSSFYLFSNVCLYLTFRLILIVN